MVWAGVVSRLSKPKRKLLIEGNFVIAPTISSCASEREEIRLTIELVKVQTTCCCGFESFVKGASWDSRV
jgi:hypothetical protein